MVFFNSLAIVCVAFFLAVLGNFLHSPSVKVKGVGNRNVSRRYQRKPHHRDISEYHVNEPAPTEEYFRNILKHLLALAAHKPDTLATLRRYVGQWAHWTKLGLSTITAFETCVQTLYRLMLDTRRLGLYLGFLSLILISGQK